MGREAGTTGGVLQPPRQVCTHPFPLWGCNPGGTQGSAPLASWPQRSPGTAAPFPSQLFGQKRPHTSSTSWGRGQESRGRQGNHRLSLPEQKTTCGAGSPSSWAAAAALPSPSAMLDARRRRAHAGDQKPALSRWQRGRGCQTEQNVLASRMEMRADQRLGARAALAGHGGSFLPGRQFPKRSPGSRGNGGVAGDARRAVKRSAGRKRGVGNGEEGFGSPSDCCEINLPGASSAFGRVSNQAGPSAGKSSGRNVALTPRGALVASRAALSAPLFLLLEVIQDKTQPYCIRG